jgi:hypothetical protein
MKLADRIAATVIQCPAPTNYFTDPKESGWCILDGAREFQMEIPVYGIFGRRRRRHDLICPLLTSAPRSGRLSTASVAEATRNRSPGVSSAAFCAQPPDLRFAPLMDMGFAVSRPLARRWRPFIAAPDAEGRAIAHHAVYAHVTPNGSPHWYTSETITIVALGDRRRLKEAAKAFLTGTALASMVEVPESILR